MWVNKPKGDGIRSRLVCKGCYQDMPDKDDVYASTPLLTSLKILLTIGLLKGHRMVFADVSTAFLHAPITEEVFVRPRRSTIQNGDVVWKLRRAMYGLRSAPKAWQDHYADVMEDLGGYRSQVRAQRLSLRRQGHHDHVVCRRRAYHGPGQEGEEDVLKSIQEKLLIRETGNLDIGSKVNFLGTRDLSRPRGYLLPCP